MWSRSDCFPGYPQVYRFKCGPVKNNGIESIVWALGSNQEDNSYAMTHTHTHTHTPQTLVFFITNVSHDTHTTQTLVLFITNVACFYSGAGGFEKPPSFFCRKQQQQNILFVENASTLTDDQTLAFLEEPGRRTAWKRVFKCRLACQEQWNRKLLPGLDAATRKITPTLWHTHRLITNVSRWCSYAEILRSHHYFFAAQNNANCGKCIDFNWYPNACIPRVAWEEKAVNKLGTIFLCGCSARWFILHCEARKERRAARSIAGRQFTTTHTHSRTVSRAWTTNYLLAGLSHPEIYHEAPKLSSSAGITGWVLILNHFLLIAVCWWCDRLLLSIASLPLAQNCLLFFPAFKNRCCCRGSARLSVQPSALWPDNKPTPVFASREFLSLDWLSNKCLDSR